MDLWPSLSLIRCMILKFLNSVPKLLALDDIGINLTDCCSE